MTTLHVVTIILNAYLGPTGNNLIHGSHDAGERARVDYLRKRGPLLSQFPLKSLAHQTTPDFHVLVLHDRSLDPAPHVPTNPLGGRLHYVGIEPIDFKRNLERAFWLPRPEEDAKIDELAGDADRLLITHIDSDDCYRFDALDRFRREALEPGCIMSRSGYIHDVSTGRVGLYQVQSPPFYTLVYDLESYRAGKRFEGGAGHHSFVPRRIPTRFVDDPMFLVNVHTANDSTRWVPTSGGALPEAEALEVLSHFGMFGADVHA